MLVPPPVPVTWQNLHVSHGFFNYLLIAPSLLRGKMIVPSPGCKTLRRACRCGWQGVLGLLSAQAPPHLPHWRPCWRRFVVEKSLSWRGFVEFHKPNDEVQSSFTPPGPGFINPAILTLVRYKQSERVFAIHLIYSKQHKGHLTGRLLPEVSSKSIVSTIIRPSFRRIVPMGYHI
jgi:hypothetical protein